MNKNTYWYCECACGTWTLNTTSQLRNGKSKSCGCLKTKATTESNKKRTIHGGSRDGKKTPEYASWVTLRHNKDSHIAEWEDFQQFFKDVGWKPSPECVLARRDVREPHSPNNTYWRHPDELRKWQDTGCVAELAINIGAIVSNTRTESGVGARDEVQRGTDWKEIARGDSVTTERSRESMLCG